MPLFKIIRMQMAYTGVLTEKILDEMSPGTVIAQGEAEDSPAGLNMMGSGRQLRWIAIRGEGTADWAIFAHYRIYTYGEVSQYGDKVCDHVNITRVIPCTNGALARYRF